MNLILALLLILAPAPSPKNPPALTRDFFTRVGWHEVRGNSIVKVIRFYPDGYCTIFWSDLYFDNLTAYKIHSKWRLEGNKLYIDHMFEEYSYVFSGEIYYLGSIEDSEDPISLIFTIGTIQSLHGKINLLGNQLINKTYTDELHLIAQ